MNLFPDGDSMLSSSEKNKPAYFYDVGIMLTWFSQAFINRREIWSSVTQERWELYDHGCILSDFV